MRPLGAAKVLEARRRRGLSLVARGLSLNEAARQLGCAPSSVMRWRDAVERHGAAGLVGRASPGARGEVARRGRHRARGGGGGAPGKKNARRLGAHLVFVDESGFLLIPSVHKTWAPRGQTPIIRHRYQRDKISVISGLSVSPVRQRRRPCSRFLLQ